MRKWLIVLAGLALTLVIAPAAAQNSCERPFEGIGIQFNPDAWPLTDFCQTTIDLGEVLGVIPPNRIPPIGFPAQPHLGAPELPAPIFEDITAAQAWLVDQSPVVVLEIEGDARAYPLAILTWHEIVNDVVGGVPVAVTFCPLCNSAIVFGRIVDEDALFFGVSGNLRNSDLIMWDDRTQSWWQQFTGEAIVGAYAGTMLTVIPSQVVGFSQFVAQHPDGQVLSRDTAASRPYGQNPYAGYDTDSQPFLFDGPLDNRLSATERVLAGIIAGEAVAYPFPLLRAQGVINDTVGDLPVVAFWQPGQASALGASDINTAADVGTAGLFRRELGDRLLTFEAAADGVIRDAETGSAWNVFGTATAGELAGEQLQLLPAAPHFWFAWAAFRPEARLVQDTP